MIDKNAYLKIKMLSEFLWWWGRNGEYSVNLGHTNMYGLFHVLSTFFSDLLELLSAVYFFLEQGV